MSRPLLSLVFPCHNEAPHVARLLRNAHRVLIDVSHEILVVADGCVDGTQDVVRGVAIEAPSIRLIENFRQLGKGGAIRRGVMEAKGTYVAFMDGDGEIDPSYARDALDVLRMHAADIVIGNRYGQGGSYHTTLRRHITSRVYQAMIWLLFGLTLHDTQAGLKAFPRDIAKKLFEASNVDGYAFDIDVLMHAYWAGYRIEEIPISQRFKGTSTISFRHVLEMVADTCSTYDHHARELRARDIDWRHLATVLRSYAFYPLTSALEFVIRAVIGKRR